MTLYKFCHNLLKVYCKQQNWKPVSQNITDFVQDKWLYVSKSINDFTSYFSIFSSIFFMDLILSRLVLFDLFFVLHFNNFVRRMWSPIECLSWSFCKWLHIWRLIEFWICLWVYTTGLSMLCLLDNILLLITIFSLLTMYLFNCLWLLKNLF